MYNLPDVFDLFHVNYLSVLNSAADLQDSEFLNNSELFKISGNLKGMRLHTCKRLRNIVCVSFVCV